MKKQLKYDSKLGRWIVDNGDRLNRKRRFFRARDEAREYLASEEFLSICVVRPKASVSELSDKPISSATVGEAVRWYGDTISVTKSKFSSRWEPRRLSDWAERWKDKPLQEIGLRELLEYRSHLLSKNSYKPQTVNRRLTLIKSFFRSCRAAGFIEDNPALELRKLPLPEPSHVEVISEEDQNKLLREAKPWVRDPLWLAMKTGLRRNEIVNLRWGAINLDQGYLLIERSEGFQTKSKRSRQLPLTPNLIQFFFSLHSEAKAKGQNKPSDFVFLTSTGRRIIPDRLTREAKKIMKRVLKRDCGAVHIWRHTALTVMLRKGADIETVRRIAGHSSLSVTQRYVHSNDSAMMAAISRLENSAGFGKNVSICVNERRNSINRG